MNKTVPTPQTPLRLRDAELSVTGAVATFSHQCPATRNALSMDLRRDYMDMLDFVEANRSIRALVITGSGGSFCAGADLKTVRERHGSTDPELNSPDAMRRNLLSIHAWLERLRTLDIPVVAAVDGPAYGAGFSMALVCDFILASTRASFCMAFAKVGLVPDLGAFYLLPRVVGIPKAKELAMTARRLGVDEAVQLGLVHSVHAPEALLAQAQAFAARFEAGPREALGMTKSLFNKSYETPYATLAELESQAQAVAAATPFHAAAVGAFLRGEPAAFDWDRTAI